jgi:hypothetical protein
MGSIETSGSSYIVRHSTQVEYGEGFCAFIFAKIFFRRVYVSNESQGYLQGQTFLTWRGGALPRSLISTSVLTSN